jgi:hypothetical protein
VGSSSLIFVFGDARFLGGFWIEMRIPGRIPGADTDFVESDTFRETAKYKSGDFFF